MHYSKSIVSLDILGRICKNLLSQTNVNYSVDFEATLISAFLSMKLKCGMLFVFGESTPFFSLLRRADQ